MHWHLSHRFDPRAVALADRHYSRQKPGTPQFVPPGRCLVLLTRDNDALWVTSWPYAEFVRHRWAGAWVCSLFRNESGVLSSELITDAIAATRWNWPDVPDLGMVTFIDRAKVRSTHPGYCYLQAGFVKDGETVGGLAAVRMAPETMPAARPPLGVTLPMMGVCDALPA